MQVIVFEMIIYSQIFLITSSGLFIQSCALNEFYYEKYFGSDYIATLWYY